MSEKIDIHFLTHYKTFSILSEYEGINVFKRKYIIDKYTFYTISNINFFTMVKKKKKFDTYKNKENFVKMCIKKK